MSGMSGQSIAQSYHPLFAARRMGIAQKCGWDEIGLKQAVQIAKHSESVRCGIRSMRLVHIGVNEQAVKRRAPCLEKSI
jgi:hypothetical protein